MVVIYIACKSLAEIAKLLNGTRKYDLEGWRGNYPSKLQFLKKLYIREFLMNLQM